MSDNDPKDPPGLGLGDEPGSGFPSAPLDGETGTPVAALAGAMERLLDVKVELCVELGRRNIPIESVLKFAPGSVVEFAKSADQPLEVRVNDQVVARGEPVVIGERYGVRITEVLDPNDVPSSTDILREASR